MSANSNTPVGFTPADFRGSATMPVDILSADGEQVLYRAGQLRTGFIATITFVSDEVSSTGKTRMCYLANPNGSRDIRLIANIPVAQSPRKWDRVIADSMKVSPVETEWENTVTGKSGRFTSPQQKCAFFGEGVTLLDAADLPTTKWVDARTAKAPVATADDSDPFATA